MPGDIFPMRVPQVGPPPRQGEFRHHRLVQRIPARWFRLSRAAHSTSVLNHCAAARVSSKSDGRSSAHRGLAPTAVQLSVEGRILRRIAAYGGAPSGANREAVHELLKTDNLDEPRPSTVASFKWERLRLLADDWPVRPR